MKTNFYAIEMKITQINLYISNPVDLETLVHKLHTIVALTSEIVIFTHYISIF